MHIYPSIYPCRRTVHSLVRLLAMFPGVRLRYISPTSLRLPVEIIQEVFNIAQEFTGGSIEQVWRGGGGGGQCKHEI